MCVCFACVRCLGSCPTDTTEVCVVQLPKCQGESEGTAAAVFLSASSLSLSVHYELEWKCCSSTVAARTARNVSSRTRLFNRPLLVPLLLLLPAPFARDCCNWLCLRPSQRMLCSTLMLMCPTFANHFHRLRHRST